LHEVRVKEGSYKWNPDEHQYEFQIDSKANGWKNSKNIVAQMISLLGAVVIILGILAGLSNDSNGVLAATYVASGIVTGLLIIGFAEVIHLLDKIYKKLNSGN
jgi:uncharacterized membrane protein YkgB